MKGHVLAVSSGYISALISFITTIFLAKMLGAENFSLISFALAVGAFSAAIVNLGTDKVFVRDYVSLVEDKQKISLARNNIRCRIFALAPVLIFGCAQYFLSGNSNLEAAAELFLFIWAALVGMYPAAWFDAVGKTNKQNLMGLLEKTTTLLLILALYAYSSYINNAIFWISFVLMISRLLSVFFQCKIWFIIFNKQNYTADKEEKSGTSLKITLSVLASGLVAYFNQMMLSWHGYKEDLGAFGLVFQFINFVILFQSQAIRIIMKNISEAREDKKIFKKNFIRHASLVVGFSAFLAILAWFCVYMMPNFLDDKGYAVAAKFSAYLCIWSVVVGFGQVIGQYALSVGLEKKYMVINFLGAIASIVLGYIYVPDGGAKLVAILLLTIHSTMIAAMGVALAISINRIDWKLKA